MDQKNIEHSSCLVILVLDSSVRAARLEVESPVVPVTSLCEIFYANNQQYSEGENW